MESFSPVAKGMARPCVVWKRIEPRVSGDAAGAADAGNHGDLVQVRLGSEQGAGEAVDRGADAASGTPDVRHAVHAEERLDGVVRVDRNIDRNFESLFVHRAASTMAFRMASGLCTLPPAWVTGMTLALPAAARATSWTIWPEVQLGHDERLHAAGEIADVLLGEGPGGDDAELAGADAARRGPVWIARCATRDVMP